MESINTNAMPRRKPGIFHSILKKIFGGHRSQPAVASRPDESFVIISDGAEDAGTLVANLEKELVDGIDQGICNKILVLQEIASMGDEAGALECCVCLGEDVNFLPLLCKHQLCTDCKSRMDGKQMSFCPVCMQEVKIVDAHKLIALVACIRESHYGIVYFPPIYRPKENDWLAHQVFPFLVY